MNIWDRYFSTSDRIDSGYEKVERNMVDIFKKGAIDTISSKMYLDSRWNPAMKKLSVVPVIQNR